MIMLLLILRLLGFLGGGRNIQFLFNTVLGILAPELLCKRIGADSFFHSVFAERDILIGKIDLIAFHLKENDKLNFVFAGIKRRVQITHQIEFPTSTLHSSVARRLIERRILRSVFFFNHAEIVQITKLVGNLANHFQR